MKLNLDNLNPGVKFLIDETNPAEGSVTLRMLDAKAAKDHRTATTKQRVEYHKGVRNVIPDVDEAKATELFWDYVLVDWEGVVDSKGKPIPCTKEMKSKLVSESPDFAKVINEMYEKLTEGAAAHTEELVKNS